ncbi:g354 [Coccomyxa viridis]|uniref:G354 protein n=1 Tax=Coccomyxa viridis TaxID=1274662 RepID=A0ABP1FH46_9CHLO
MSAATQMLAGATPRVPRGWTKVLAVWSALGVDLHGSDPTVASVKAVREALDKVSLPTLLVDVPGGVKNARVKAKIGVPKHAQVNKEKLKEVLGTIAGKVDEPKLVGGGLRWHSGIIAPKMGDPPPDAQVDAETSDDEEAPQTCHDEMLLAVASIRVGY